MTEYIPNSNILIHDRLYENKDIYCGNRLDTLVDNRCYHGDQDPYIATCPIKYDMYKVNNKYSCYKNCPESTKSAEITSIDYKININGKQCLQKKFINK
jgi:hypothetical protein